MEHIKTLIAQGSLIQKKYPRLWWKEFSDVLAALESISLQANRQIYGEQEIAAQLNALPIAPFESFGEYIKAKNISASGYRFPSLVKRERRVQKCPTCQSTNFDFNSTDRVYVCASCGTVVSKKQNSHLMTKDTNNEAKHITKQLNIVSGKLLNPPVHIKKVLPFIKIWFTERIHLYNWLQYSDGYESFINKLSKDEAIDEEWFRRFDEKLCSYTCFKLTCDEFYKLTELLQGYEGFINNMNSLPPQLQLEICTDYHNSHGILPLENDTHQYHNNTYDIGKYIIYWRTHDIHSNTNIKQALNKLFGMDITLPGLIFEFSDICGTKGNILRRFNYQQNYIFIIKEVYNIKLVSIMECDKQKIVEIMLDFNKYVKAIKSYEESSKNHNSCLWPVVLSLILSLPYYRCYADIIKILPFKSKSTILGIRENWSNYCIDKHEQLRLFKTTLRQTIETNDDTKTVVSNGEVDMGDIYGFINGTGHNWQDGDDDGYLKEKLNISDNTDAWWLQNDVDEIGDVPTRSPQISASESSDVSDDSDDLLCSDYANDILDL